MTPTEWKEAQLAQPEHRNDSEHLEPVVFDSEMKAQAKRAYPHDAKRELAFIDGWLSREATQQQNSVATDWAAVHDKLMDVWHRELSADEGLDEIQGLINTTPPQRTWVGLTPEEVKEISLANRPYVVDMVVALEARLKEKNHGT